MIDRETPVLIDTNVIIEAHRTKIWPLLSGHYKITTVEKCVEECDTGNQRRNNTVDIDTASLRSRVKVVTVSDLDKAALFSKCPENTDIDAGEQELLAHAVALMESFVICSPDKACVRVGHKLDIQQLISRKPFLYLFVLISHPFNFLFYFAVFFLSSSKSSQFIIKSSHK